MSLNLIPALRGHGRRRAVDKVAELRRDLNKVLTYLHAAGDEIALLHNDVREAQAAQRNAEEVAVQQQQVIDDLTDERNYWRDEALALKARFSTQLAADANAHRITVPGMVRPVDGPEDQATGPIDVRPLQEAAAAGLLGPVTDPGRVQGVA